MKLTGLDASADGSIQWLKAPAIDSHTGVTLGGSEIGPAGEFSPRTQAKIIAIRHGRGRLELPPYSRGGAIEEQRARAANGLERIYEIGMATNDGAPQLPQARDSLAWE